MLPKQLKDSQRHQRQPKQVELFLQSQIWQNCQQWQWLWWSYGNTLPTKRFIFQNYCYATFIDHCTETKKRSGQTGDRGKKVVYGDGRIRIATGIASTSKYTPPPPPQESFLPAARLPTPYYPAPSQETRSPTPPPMSPPLRTPGNPIIIEDDDEELDRLDDNFYTAESMFSTPVSFLLYCRECTNRQHQYFECPQYICNHCYQQAPGHHMVSDCPRSWSQWLQP